MQVVAHLREIGADQGKQCLAAWPPTAGLVEDVFKTIFAHLDDQVGNV